MTFTNQFSETPNHQHQRSKQTFFFLFFFLCFFHTDKKELQRLSLAWKTREKRKTLLVIEFCMGIFPHECNREGGAALLFWSNTTEETRRKKKKERKKKEGKKKKIKMTVTEIQAKMNDMLSVDCPPGPNILPHYYGIFLFSFSFSLFSVSFSTPPLSFLLPPPLSSLLFPLFTSSVVVVLLPLPPPYPPTISSFLFPLPSFLFSHHPPTSYQLPKRSDHFLLPLSHVLF